MKWAEARDGQAAGRHNGHLRSAEAAAASRRKVLEERAKNEEAAPPPLPQVRQKHSSGSSKCSHWSTRTGRGRRPAQRRRRRRSNSSAANFSASSRTELNSSLVRWLAPQIRCRTAFCRPVVVVSVAARGSPTLASSSLLSIFAAPGSISQRPTCGTVTEAAASQSSQQRRSSPRQIFH